VGQFLAGLFIGFLFFSPAVAGREKIQQKNGKDRGKPQQKAEKNAAILQGKLKIYSIRSVVMIIAIIIMQILHKANCRKYFTNAWGGQEKTADCICWRVFPPRFFICHSIVIVNVNVD